MGKKEARRIEDSDMLRNASHFWQSKNLQFLRCPRNFVSVTKKEESLGLTVKKDDDFSEWYTQVILKSELIDYSSVSGCLVFRPASYALWENIMKVVDPRLKDMDVKNCYFPLFIPEALLKKEETHVEGFTPEVAWVTEAGHTKLNERLAVRPTSETIMYDSYAKWIRSWRDLPLKLNQWNNVVRWEFKHPIPFIRTREFLWNEGHTAFATKEECEQEIKEIIDLWKDVCENYLALPALVGRKTEKEKFAGAIASYSLEFFLPDGKAAQGPDAHFDGQNFAKAFDIKFLNKDGNEEYAWQNTWAISTRMIGILAMVHGDDKGLIIPPKIASVHAVIVPILFDNTKDKVIAKASEVKKMLSDFNVFVDERAEYTPGWKFNEWELKGVPLRIEIGPKDLEKEQVVFVRRDISGKEFVKIKDLKKKVIEVMASIQDNLFERAKKFLNENTVLIERWEDFIKAIASKKLVKAFYCGVTECEDYVKEKTNGAKALNISFEQPELKGKKCIYCKKNAKFLVNWAKSF